MTTKDISVGGQVFHCPIDWTVDEAKDSIRSRFLLQGGGLEAEGLPLLGSALISTTTGSLAFVGGVSQQGSGDNFPTPGDSNVMFLVLKLTRGKGKKNTGKIIGAEPVGTSFAMSDKLLFTAAHNVCNKRGVQQEIGVVRYYENPVFIDDIIVLTHVDHCSDNDEDWAVYQRTVGHFCHSAHICPASELPLAGVRIGIKNYPVGIFTAGSVTKLTLDSFHTKVSNYQVFVDTVVSKKRKYGVSETKPAPVLERVTQVMEGRVKGSCGSVYFESNGKVIALQKKSVDEGRDEVSISNSYTLDRNHTFHSVGLVLCRLPKFCTWYSKNFDDKIESNESD